MFQGRAYTKAPDVHRYSIPERTLSQESRRKNNPVFMWDSNIWTGIANGKSHDKNHKGVLLFFAFE